MIVSIHSFRGGTGKSNVTASLAALAAARGRRVGVMDTDIQTPGIHALFGLDSRLTGHSLNDYLWSRCAIADTARDVKLRTGHSMFLIPSALRTGEIARVLREGYDVGRLHDGVHDLIDCLALDVLFVDTHPGLNEETLMSIAMSDTLVIVMRPDRQDYQGTGVTVEVANRLKVPRSYLLVNKVPATLDHGAVRRQVSEAYGCEVIAVLPVSDEMLQLGSGDVFAAVYPEHPLTKQLATVADALLAGGTDG